jgi:hypothetical protein
MEIVAELKETAPVESHAMVVIDHTIYIIDGNKLLKMDMPYETVWRKILKYLGIKT